MQARGRYLISLIVRRLMICAAWGIVTGLVIALALVSLCR